MRSRPSKDPSITWSPAYITAPPNTLGSISLFATSLAHELADDESLGSLADHLVDGVRTLEHIVANVLEFAKPRRLSMTQVDLAEVVRSSLT